MDPTIALAEPKAKRRDTLMELDQIPPQFVAYKDYAKLYNHFIKVTDLVNEFRINLIESAAAKLGAKIAETCEPLNDLTPIGNPVMAPPIFLDNDPSFPVASSSPRKPPAEESASRNVGNKKE